MHILESALTLYAWIATTILIAAMFFIARFYELKSGKHTRYRVFLAPALLFLVAGGRYAFFTKGDWVGDFEANLLFLCGGIVALILGNRLLRNMTGGQG